MAWPNPEHGNERSGPMKTLQVVSLLDDRFNSRSIVLVLGREINRIVVPTLIRIELIEATLKAHVAHRRSDAAWRAAV